MILCILATSDNVEEVRKAAVAGMPKLGKNKLLTIPVSESGTGEATHWFCYLHLSQDVVNKFLALKNLSEMEISDPIDFLNKRNLKMIPKE